MPTPPLDGKEYTQTLAITNIEWRPVANPNGASMFVIHASQDVWIQVDKAALDPAVDLFGFPILRNAPATRRYRHAPGFTDNFLPLPGGRLALQIRAQGVANANVWIEWIRE